MYCEYVTFKLCRHTGARVRVPFASYSRIHTCHHHNYYFVSFSHSKTSNASGEEHNVSGQPRDIPLCISTSRAFEKCAKSHNAQRNALF